MKKFSLQNRSINESEQAEKLKSCEMKDKWWMMNDENFKLFGVLTYDGQTDEGTFVIVESLSRLKNLGKPCS